MNVSLKHAEAVIKAAQKAAKEIGVPVNVAVLDSGGHLTAFARMDGAVLGSIDIALKKAKTAILFRMNSEAVGEFCKPGGPSQGLAATNDVLVVPWNRSPRRFRTSSRRMASRCRRSTPAPI